MTNATHPNFRIIIIDDNPSIHHDFIKILKTETSSRLESARQELFGMENPSAAEGPLPSFEIDTASQGQEGVERIREAFQAGEPYALAFVDIRMPPGWNGIETIKHIWEIDKNIQVVICTAYSDYSWEETLMHLGRTDNLLILKKPFDNVSVRQLAFALTSKWRLAEETRHYLTDLQKQVTDRTFSLQKSLKELEFQANHDLLTGLANRAQLQDKMKQAIKTAEKEHSSFAVLFLDLDRFKLVNDSLSHQVGDELLTQVAERLQRSIQNNDTLARLGGDEFVIILSNVKDENDVAERVKSILGYFQKPFDIAGRHITMTTSIGIGIYPRDGDAVDILLRNADTAMYSGKAQKGNTYQFYTQKMSEKNLAILEQEAELRQAIEKEEFFLVYQPQFDLNKQKIVGVEALIRWQHPVKGTLLPLDFVPLAEETGLIVPIGEWVLRKACSQNKEWQEAGLSPLRVAVNVTAQQFKHYDLVAVVGRILEETRLDPKYLEIELTENVILSNHEIIKATVRLKKLGVIIAIDDFGTGYSSLSYLHKIPLDRLKIDGSFISHINSPEDDEVIIRAIIAMAKNLNLEVLAEGVETSDQLNFLKKYDCKDIQGFYFSTPLTSEKIKEYLSHPEKTSPTKDFISR